MPARSICSMSRAAPIVAYGADGAVQREIEARPVLSTIAPPDRKRIGIRHPARLRRTVAARSGSGPFEHAVDILRLRQILQIINDCAPPGRRQMRRARAAWAVPVRRNSMSPCPSTLRRPYWSRWCGIDLAAT